MGAGFQPAQAQPRAWTHRRSKTCGHFGRSKNAGAGDSPSWDWAGYIDPNAPPVRYWFRLERDGSGGARYAAEKIDDDSGVGTQVAVANNRGMFAFTQK